MEVANTLAYYDTAAITAVKSFIVQAHGRAVSRKTSPLKMPITRARWNGAALSLGVFSGTEVSAVRRFRVVAAPGPDL